MSARLHAPGGPGRQPAPPAVTMLRMGTRRSPLARWQTAHVAELLCSAWPDLHCETRPFETAGDRHLEEPLVQIGGKGVFTEALEQALLGGEIDVAVHSQKDLPVESAGGLTTAAIITRADARDVLVSDRRRALDQLASGASIGTSSPRRRAQLLAMRPDLNVLEVRGNVGTRVNKVRDGELQAVVLAAAGIARLGLEAMVAEWLPFDRMLPAPGQGALAVQCRATDHAIRQCLAAVHDPHSAAAVAAERAFLAALGGGCAVPVAAHAEVGADGMLFMRGLVLQPDGRRRIAVEGSGADAVLLGRRLAAEAIERGAAELLGRG